MSTMDKMKELFEQNTVVDEQGRVSFEAGLYEKSIKMHDLTVDQVKRMNKANEEIVYAMTHATASKALPVAKKNKNIEQFSGKLKTVGYDSFDISIKPRGEVFNPKSKEKEDRFALTRVVHNTRSTKNSGDNGKLRKELNETWGKALKG